MRILPVSTNLYTKQSLPSDRSNAPALNLHYLSLPQDSVSFTHRIIKPIKTVKEFKTHALKRIYNCMYCNIPMKYDEQMFNSWKNANYFSMPIGKFVKKFRWYKDSLHDSQRQIFDFVEHVSKKSPDAKLDTVIKLMAAKANRELLTTQEPIFDAMAVEAAKLPETNKKAVLNLIAKSKYRVLRIPHEEEFSGKELRYKFERLSKTMPSEKAAKRINNLAELLTIPAIYKQTEPLTDKVVIRILRTINPNTKFNKTNNISRNYTAKRLNEMIIEAIKHEVKNTKRKDIYNLCIDAEKMLRGEPIVAKFTNRSFSYDLWESIQDIPLSSKVRSELFRLANSLPTSDNNVYAFITKHDQSASEKIAYDLFTPSELTLEHQEPSSLGGPNIIANWAMACKRCNNSRQHKDMGDFYKLFGKKNAQIYWDQIIEDANKGYFDFEDVVGMLKIFKQQSRIKIQSKHLKFRPPSTES